VPFFWSAVTDNVMHTLFPTERTMQVPDGRLILLFNTHTQATSTANTLIVLEQQLDQLRDVVRRRVAQVLVAHSPSDLAVLLVGDLNSCATGSYRRREALDR